MAGADPSQATDRYDAAVATVAEPESVLLPGHDVPLGRYTTVRRLLPQRPRRMVGAWCFVDLFGPDEVAGTPGMQVPPHPHTGLQTVTWLMAGEVRHRDSLGSLATVRPGELNVMTSGHGIAHSEESPPEHPPVMHGLQLWVALPEAARHGAASFDHHPHMPVVADGGLTTTVVVGDLGGVRSPATTYSPLLAADVTVAAGTDAALPLEPDFEYAALSISGEAEVAGAPLAPGSLLYLGYGRGQLPLAADRDARLFLLGGEPFAEPLVMWWNFVGRSHDEIVTAREDWQAGRRFGTVEGYPGDPLPAPTLPTTRLKARDRHGNTFAG
ncbi:pirin family protein [Natronosporangium hydrolyticum]|uniref:Pirin family protein n=1 Tax=Natronosporangium hydrolyticum TaxID=2811111 RepID=A0A895Y5P5_9ACTN|nr:pirin family protein [Natronosporangium hydrolyticum]QSB13037.1 pirin family protein [Natronosporangium hydrolyticum]